MKKTVLPWNIKSKAASKMNINKFNLIEFIIYDKNKINRRKNIILYITSFIQNTNTLKNSQNIPIV